MKTKPWAIALIILCSLSNAIAMFFLKKGAETIEFSFSILSNIWIYLGILTLMLSVFLMMTALKGGNLSVIYPILATTYIWMSLLAMILLNEPISTIKWIGIILIVIGVAVVGTEGKISLKKQVKHEY
jgi:uncharacterized membrane protein